MPTTLLSSYLSFKVLQVWLFVKGNLWHILEKITDFQAAQLHSNILVQSCMVCTQVVITHLTKHVCQKLFLLMTTSIIQVLPWPKDSYSTHQKNSTLWNPKVHHAHKSQSMESVLSQFNPIHIFTTNFSNEHFNIILSNVPHGLSSTWLLTTLLYAFHFIYVCCISCPSHPSWFHHLNSIMCRV
jgi:hypothetical protein